MFATVPLVRVRSAPTTETAPEALTLTRSERVWCTVVHDDPVNTMTYVTWVFRRYFGFSLPVAQARMLQVHRTGRAVVSRGTRPAMERDVVAMHGFGLRATLEPLGGQGDDGAGTDGPSGSRADGAGGGGR